MKQQRSKPVYSPILKGAKVDAKYSEAQISDYVDNPLILALPPIWEPVRALELMTRNPEYYEADRLLPSHLRRHIVGRARRFFQPLPIHLRIQQNIDVMIRQGLLARNHFCAKEKFAMRKRLEVADPTDPYGLAARDAQDWAKVNKYYSGGMAMVGVTGVGKSYCVECILSLYPQVIFHSKYRGQEFPLQQIVWLKLVCPPDGSIKALCLSFFDAIDQILDTPYHRAYSSLSVDQMLQRIRKLAFEHAIGVLIIDEIQDLSEAKSGGAQRMLNFFVHLENIVHMPVILIGTLKAMPLLNRELRHARRNSTEGDVLWMNMQNDKNWKCFTEALWVHQYVRNPTPWTAELSDTLYEVTQGIAAFAVTVFSLAQVRAMDTGTESITPVMITSVQDRIQIAKPLLDALRKKNWTEIVQYSDTKIDFDQLLMMEEYQRPIRLERKPKKALSQSTADITVDVDQKIADSGTTNFLVTSGGTPKPATLQPSSSQPNEVQRSRSHPSEMPGSLAQIISSGLKDEKAAYQSLKEAGYLRAADEFMSYVE